MLLGPKIGIVGYYYKRTEEEMFAEYEKAIDRIKVEKLEVEETEYQRFATDIEMIKK